MSFICNSALYPGSLGILLNFSAKQTMKDSATCERVVLHLVAENRGVICDRPKIIKFVDFIKATRNHIVRNHNSRTVDMSICTYMYMLRGKNFTLYVLSIHTMDLLEKDE